MKFLSVIIPLASFLLIHLTETKRNNGNRNDRPRRHNKHNSNSDLSLWIDENQVKRFSGEYIHGKMDDRFHIIYDNVQIESLTYPGFPMEIQIITDGSVQHYILDPNFENYLPVIPSEV